MARFSTFPALRASTFDLGEIQDRAAQRGALQSRNALAERQLGLGERRNALAERQFGLEEQRFNQERAANEKQMTIEKVARVGAGYLQAPDDMRAAQWPKMREVAIGLGADPSTVPEQFGPEADQYVREQVARVLPLSSLKDMAFPEPDQTSVMVNAEALGLRPGTDEYKEYIRQVTTKPLIEMPKNVTETEAMVEQIAANRAKFEQTGDARFERVADALEMKLVFGGKPPEAYAKARGALTQAREGLAGVYRLIEGGAGAILPTDRAKLRQKFEQARLGYAELTNRGANFTESEQAMIAAVLGGDPNDVVQRALRGDQSYLNDIRTAGEAIEARGKELIATYTSPRVEEFTYPWQQKQPEAPSSGWSIQRVE